MYEKLMGGIPYDLEDKIENQRSKLHFRNHTIGELSLSQQRQLHRLI